jgi:hypothetical protein
MTILLPGVVQEVSAGSVAGNAGALGNRVKNQSTAAQTPAATVRTNIAGGNLPVPPAGLKVGTRLRWVFQMTKTAAGSAASTFDIALGTTGTVADAAVVSFTKPAGTAAADEGRVVIEALVKTVSATGVINGEFTLVHNLAATGHAVIPCVVVFTASGATDLTPQNLIASLNITSGAADAITIGMVDSELTESAG